MVIGMHIISEQNSSKIPAAVFYFSIQKITIRGKGNCYVTESWHTLTLFTIFMKCMFFLVLFSYGWRRALTSNKRSFLLFKI